jgi:hypothetical protein
MQGIIFLWSLAPVQYYCNQAGPALELVHFNELLFQSGQRPIRIVEFTKILVVTADTAADRGVKDTWASWKSTSV